jgi:hypothetical protein
MVHDVINDYGACGGIKIGRRNRNTRRKLILVTVCPPQISHDLISNTGRRGGKPATDYLNYGVASTRFRCNTADNISFTATGE